MKKITLCVVLVLSVVFCISAQDFVEVRAGVTKDGVTYRYIDYNHTFKNGLVVDVAHYGAPGQNEGWLGLGKFKQFNESTAATFAAYVVVGKENKQLGVGVSSWGSSNYKKVNVNYQTYAFIPVRGDVKKYLSVDSFEVTYKASKKVEVGGSAGMFWTGPNTNLIAGPMIKFNDKLGSFNISVRGGQYTEFRVGRTFNFDFSKLK